MRGASLVAAVIFSSIVAAAANPVQSADYQAGDLYLLSQSLPKPGGGAIRGIVRIDPTSGTSTLLYSTGVGLGSYLAYDPFRDLLVFARVDSLLGITASGSVSTLADLPAAPGALAARGDGYIYMQINSELHYLDTGNVLQPVLDAPGTATFSIGGPGSIREMRYDEGTGSLLAFFSGGAIGVCPDATQVCVAKIPLTAPGTQVAGAVAGAQVEVSTSGEAVVGSGALPSGQVLFVVDTNSNAQESRMLALDPATLVIGGFAANGSYTGAAATNAGTYSSVRGEAVILDTFADALRGFSQGNSGNGTIFSGSGSGFGVSSAGGSGEAARLVEIIPVPTPVRGAALPSHLILEAPYPNPFNPATAVRFHLASAARARLDVFDVRGRLVRTLADGQLSAGWQEATWDGRGADGSAVASGVYFVRLSSGGETRTQRFVVVR
jgi:hypothetical protein